MVSKNDQQLFKGLPMAPSKMVPQKLRPYLRAYRQRRSARDDVFRAFNSDDGPPVLVYQMGKVGSTTVHASLEAAGLGERVLSAHCLSDDLPAKRARYIRSVQYPPAYHFDVGRFVRKRLRSRSPRHLKIVTLVRDPIARLISNVYEVPGLMGADVDSESGLIDPAKSTKFVKEAIHGEDPFRYASTWFDREINSVFGIDVFAHSFPKDRGWTILRATSVDILVMRLEDLSSEGPNALAKFLGLERPIQITPSRLRRESADGESYREVTSAISLPRLRTEKAYDSRFVRHFYSDDMIESFIERWSPVVAAGR